MRLVVLALAGARLMPPTDAALFLDDAHVVRALSSRLMVAATQARRPRPLHPCH